MLDFVALAFLAIFTVLFHFNEARNSFMARATWVIIAGAWVMEPTKADETMQTIWRMGCVLASFWAPLKSSWAKVFFFNYLPLSIRNSSPLVTSSLQRYVCFTSTRSHRGKSHDIDRSFPRRVPHGFTRLEGDTYLFVVDSFHGNVQWNWKKEEKCLNISNENR